MFLLHDQMWKHRFLALAQLLLLDLDLMLHLDVAMMKYCTHFLQHINMKVTLRIQAGKDLSGTEVESKGDAII
jgi:hypothetical protein